MEKIWYGALGCFIGTIAAFFLFPYWYHSNPFFVLTLPMWIMVLGIAIGATVRKKK